MKTFEIRLEVNFWETQHIVKLNTKNFVEDQKSPNINVRIDES